MNEKKSKIRKIINRKIEESTFLPSDGLWDNIESSLDNGTDKRKFIFFWSIGTLGLLTLVLLFLGSPSNEKHITVDEKNEIQQTNKAETKTTHNPAKEIEDTNIKTDYATHMDGNPSLKKAASTNSPLVKSNFSEAAIISNKLNTPKNVTLEKNTVIKLKTNKAGADYKFQPELATKTHHTNNTDNKEGETLNKTVLDNDLSIEKTDTQSRVSKIEKLRNEEENKNPLVNEAPFNLIKINSSHQSAELANNTSGHLTQKSSHQSSSKIIEKEDSLKLKTTSLSNLSNDNVSDSIFELNNNEKSPWSIRAIGTPTYFNIQKNKSIIGQDLETNKKEGQFTFNYGIEANLALTQKMSLSLGIAQAKYAYSIDEIALSNVADRFWLASLPGLDLNEAILDNDTLFLKESSMVQLKQEIEYLEVPLTLDYTIIGKKKVGLKVLGGMSAYFLKNKDIYIENQNGDTMLLGTAENLSQLNLSFNVGVGFYAEISNNLFFELRPTYKYQFNAQNIQSLDNTSYSYGINFGLRYIFGNKKRDKQKKANDY